MRVVSISDNDNDAVRLHDDKSRLSRKSAVITSDDYSLNARRVVNERSGHSDSDADATAMP
jgi:hypothetical protein